MSSPGARQRRRRQQYQSPRTRREIATASLVAVAIVGATALLIWMLRPGGIADRQPRSSWLLGLACIAVAVACYVILRPRSRVRADRRLALGGALGGIVVVTLVAAIAWPGGLLRHTPKQPTFTSTPTAATGGSTTAPVGGSSTTARTTRTTTTRNTTTRTTQTTKSTQTTIP